MKKLIVSLSITILASLSLLGCDNKATTDHELQNGKTTLKVGVCPDPYSDLFRKAVKPILEQQGYKIEMISFPGMLEIDIALAEGAIDFNVSQHTAYLKAFNSKMNSNIVPLVHTPSIPAGLFSNKHKSLQDIKEGALIAIPQDPSNAARAYNLLAKAKLITLKPNADPVFATHHDILENPYKLNIKEIASASIPRMMQDIDAGVITGTFVFTAGFKGKDALTLETIVPDLEILVALNPKSLDTPWAQAIKAAYQSDAFKQYMQQHNTDGTWVLSGEQE